MHKKAFSLETGPCLTGEPYGLRTFAAKEEAGAVWVRLPAAEELDRDLATGLHLCRDADETQHTHETQDTREDACVSECADPALQW